MPAVRVLAGSRPMPSAFDIVLASILVAVPALSTLFAWTAIPWQTDALQFLCFSAAGMVVIVVWKEGRPIPSTAWLLAVAALPALGVLQLLVAHPIYRFATQQATLTFASYAALTFAASWLLRGKRSRDLLLSGLLLFGIIASVCEIVQIFGFGHYRTMDSGYPLLSSNYYAELIELLLPIALMRAFRRPRQAMLYAAVSTLFLATVFTSGERLGSALTLLEFAIIFALACQRSLVSKARLRALLLATPLLLSLFLLLEGPGTLMDRLREKDPLAARREITTSTEAIFKAHPLLGTGLGTFLQAYPGYATFDNGYIINHAHDDWLEFAAEGGVLFPAALLVLFLIVAPAAWQSGWGLGVFATAIHAFTDFPMHRFGVMTTLLLIMAAVQASASQHRQSKSTALVVGGSPLKV